MNMMSCSSDSSSSCEDTNSLAQNEYLKQEEQDHLWSTLNEWKSEMSRYSPLLAQIPTGVLQEAVFQDGEQATADNYNAVLHYLDTVPKRLPFKTPPHLAANALYQVLRQASILRLLPRTY